MKNTNPYTRKLSEAGKIGASRRWSGHLPVKWTSIRVGSLVKLHLQHDSERFGFTSLNEYLHNLHMWSGDIMKRRAGVLEKDEGVRMPLARRRSKCYNTTINNFLNYAGEKH